MVHLTSALGQNRTRSTIAIEKQNVSFSPGCPQPEKVTAPLNQEPAESVEFSQGCPTPDSPAASAAETLAHTLVSQLENGCPLTAANGTDKKTRALLKQTESVATKASAPATGPLGLAVADQQVKKQNGGCPYLGRTLAESAPQAETQKVGVIEFARGILEHHKDPVEFFEEFHDRHGDSFRVNVPGRKMVFDNRSEVMKKALLSTDPRNGEGKFHKPELQGHGLSYVLGKDNIFLANGETWKPVHDIVAPQFASKKLNSDGFMGTMGAVVDQHVGRLKSSIGDGKTINIKTEMQKATLDVALQTLLGTKLSDEKLESVQESFQVWMKNLTVESLNPTPWSISNLPWKNDLKKAQKELEGLAESIIAEKKKKEPEDNVIGALLAAGLPDERVKNEVLTLMLAGHETTATLLSWSFAELARDQVMQEKLRQETATITKGSAKELRGANGIKNTIMETLRLYSPAYFLVREASVDQELKTEEGSLKLEKGEQLIMSSYHMHRDEERWGEDAEEFNPDRFAEKRRDFMAPFGAGTRSCIGQLMARNEAALILTRFLQNFQWSSEGDIGMLSDVSVSPENSTIQLKPLEKARPEWQIAA